jgi:parallel beta-helix repeat protein
MDRRITAKGEKKMKKTVLIISTSLLLVVGVYAQTTHQVCQECGPYPHQYTTITAAIAAAQPGDIINIWGEETYSGSEIIYEYEEYLEITKQLTLTCENPLPTLGYPIITHAFTGSPPPDAIIHIQSGADETVIRHVNIRGPVTGEITYCGTLQPLTPDDPLSCMDTRTGIRIDADDCTVYDVSITRCMTGIYMTGTGNYINGNHIGDWYWTSDYPNPFDGLEAYWSRTNNLLTIHHPGNGFGIVAVEPDWTMPQGRQYESRTQNRITDNIIRSNRYWGVVLTNGSRAEVAHNIIAWNGDYSVDNDWTAIPDKSGGLLSLFTQAQISNISNDNKLQCPVVRSNNIYGNKGYQVGVFTGAPGAGDERCKRIYNSPVIMSNIIGVEEDMPPVMTPSQYDFLISAGPTPERTNTPTPQTIITPATPIPTATPEPCNPDYPFYGSGPIFAWNNYHDPTDGHQRRMYHPMQYDRWPPAVYTFTPTPTEPTNTPTPSPTWTPVPTVMPTGMPTITPFPTITATQGPGYYNMNDRNWEIPGMKEDPRFVGWVSPTPGLPPEYDWHLHDYQTIDPTVTQTPQVATITPSQCFNRGGIELNPGTTRADGMRDTGFVDMGRHIREPVPLVENVTFDTSELPRYELTIEWDIPDYYPDGTLFHFYDIGGHILYWGMIDPESQPGNPVTKPIGQPVYLDASTTWFTFDIRTVPPREATHIGIIIYTVRLTESEIEWLEIPTE